MKCKNCKSVKEIKVDREVILKCELNKAVTTAEHNCVCFIKGGDK